jgi:SAM-dependent methyltransferase
MPQDNTKRFSNRVEDYVKYRPHYPAEIIPFLQSAYGLSTDKLIADIGAGTGISTELFLDAGYRVIAVEPNTEMREKAIELLGDKPGFEAQDGTAEDTGLDSGSVDAIVAAQAFHWFDREQVKAEFQRILKPGGLVVLIWNERLTASAFEKEYDELIIRHGKDYRKVDHRNIDTEKIKSFFAPLPCGLKIFPNQQLFDFEGLQGRLLSSSYMPSADDEGYEAMVADLRALFDKYPEGGMIRISYETKVYVGRV